MWLFSLLEREMLCTEIGNNFQFIIYLCFCFNLCIFSKDFKIKMTNSFFFSVVNRKEKTWFKLISSLSFSNAVYQIWQKFISKTKIDMKWSEIPLGVVSFLFCWFCRTCRCPHGMYLAHLCSHFKPMIAFLFRYRRDHSLSKSSRNSFWCFAVGIPSKLVAVRGTC